MNCCCPFSSPRSRAGRIAGRILLAILVGLALAVVFGAAVMWLWNATLPGLFGFRAIRFGQAIALVILARLLFGRFGCHHRGRHWRRWHREGRWGCEPRESQAGPGPETPESH